MVNPAELTREDHTLRTAIRMAEVVASLAKLIDALVEEGVRRIAVFSLKPHEWGVKRLLHTRSVVVRLQHPAKMDDQKHDDNHGYYLQSQTMECKKSRDRGRADEQPPERVSKVCGAAL